RVQRLRRIADHDAHAVEGFAAQAAYERRDMAWRNQLQPTETAAEGLPERGLERGAGHLGATAAGFGPVAPDEGMAIRLGQGQQGQRSVRAEALEGDAMALAFGPDFGEQGALVELASLGIGAGIA